MDALKAIGESLGSSYRQTLLIPKADGFTLSPSQ